MHATRTTPKNLVIYCNLNQTATSRKKKRIIVGNIVPEEEDIVSTLDPRLSPYSAGHKNKLCACADGSCAAKSPSSWYVHCVNVCVQQAVLLYMHKHFVVRHAYLLNRA